MTPSGMKALLVIALLATTTIAHAEKVVAIAPLSTLGAEDTSAATKQLLAQLEQSVGLLPDHKVVTSQQVADAIKKAKRPQLKVCEGDSTCLTELGKLVNAQYVIAGEVGGLGSAAVVYLNLTDVSTGKELRSTTISIGATDDKTGGTNGAAARLLDPTRYTGYIHFAIDAAGATVYVNGSKVTLSAKNDILLPVGPQAVRVTHPEYVDFVRFVDVPFGKTAELTVPLQQYKRIEHDVQGKPINRDSIVYKDPPMWRRWYVVVPAAVVLGAIVGAIVAFEVHELPGAVCRKVGGEDC